jgi:hypothetical protein
MGAHDETNRAEPQNEFLSGFKIKSTQEQSFDNNNTKNNGDSGSQKVKNGLQNTSGTNPYQLIQQSGKKTNLEQSGNDYFEKKTAGGFIQKFKGKIFHGKSNNGGAKQKIMVVMIPILFLVMVFMFRQVLSKSPQKSKAAPVKEKKVTALNKSSKDGDIEWKIPDPLPVKIGNSTAANTLNPNIKDNQGKISGNEEIGVMDVKSILYSDDKPSVVIGNKLVYLNQAINGITVCEIHKDYIVFEKDGIKWNQKIAEDDFQKKQDVNIPGQEN